jgi:hypothetical protein
MRDLKDQAGRTIVESPRLIGSKFAVRRAGCLYVSPSMMKLLRDCQSPDDLFAMLDQIPCRVASASRPFPQFDG